MMMKWVATLLLALLPLGLAGDDSVQNSTSDDAKVRPSRVYMQKYEVAHLDDKAVCNDGSSGVYYHRIGSPLNSTRWIIRFLGGAWCWDEASCQARSINTPYLISSTMLPPNISATTQVNNVPDVVVQTAGITSTEYWLNPSYHSWAHVHIWYCSSDSHLGDVSPGEESGLNGWQFRGKRIAAAVMEDLFQQHGLANATHVLLTGDSAGGVGAMNNADWIGSMLRQRAPQLQNYKVFVDAGWFMDIAPYASRKDGFTFQKAARALAGPWNATFDRSCMDFFGHEECWRCFFAASCHSFLETPAMFHEYLYDSANLGYDSAAWSQFNNFRRKLTASIRGRPVAEWNVTGGNCTAGAMCSETPAMTPASLTQAVEYAEGQSKAVKLAPSADLSEEDTMQSALDPAAQSSNVSDMSPASKRGPNVFAPACHLHEIIDGALFTKSSIGDVWLVDELEDWYADTKHSVFMLDPHEGLESDALCGTTPKATLLLAAAMARYLVLEAGRSV